MKVLYCKSAFYTGYVWIGRVLPAAERLLAASPPDGQRCRCVIFAYRGKVLSRSSNLGDCPHLRRRLHLCTHTPFAIDIV